jgi:hypothetical protein
MTVSALTLWAFSLSSEFGSAHTDTFINTRHSRKLESEADERAQGLLTSAGFSPEAVPEALIRLATARQGWQPPILAEHPPGSGGPRAQPPAATVNKSKLGAYAHPDAITNVTTRPSAEPHHRHSLGRFAVSLAPAEPLLAAFHRGGAAGNWH